MPKNKKRPKKKTKKADPQGGAPRRVIVARTIKDDIEDLLSGTKALLADINEAARKLGYKDAEDMRRSRREGIAKGIYTLAKPGWKTGERERAE